MIRFAQGFAKKIIVASVAAVTVGGAVIATATPAAAGHSTGTWKYGYGYGYRPGWGYNGAAAGAVALGIVAGAAAAAAYAPTCYYSSQPVYDAYGNVFYRRVRVCD
ncbi:hypothetical protein [Chelatococcus reniformis]|uniref:Uncharacterized protein n=1 Tax=Chelatococcus reniformis TaxID=1494448 RepID=A0A916XMS8_9HYPH|nr:hypothetical protein [Chelatococcus reniformis]GGC83419.1 hypothetical protein GCM10010994_46630 [Chelatococcus reniformis]